MEAWQRFIHQEQPSLISRSFSSIAQLCPYASFFPSVGGKLHSPSASGALLSSQVHSFFSTIFSARSSTAIRRLRLHLTATVSSSQCLDSQAHCVRSLLPALCVLSSLHLPQANLDPLSLGPKPMMALIILTSAMSMCDAFLATSSSFVVSECAWPFRKASFQALLVSWLSEHTV